MNSSSSLKKYYFILEGSKNKKYKIKREGTLPCHRLRPFSSDFYLISPRFFIFLYRKKTRKFLYRLFRSFYFTISSSTIFFIFSLDFYCIEKVSDLIFFPWLPGYIFIFAVSLRDLDF